MQGNGRLNVDDLVGEMTLEEKASLCSGSSFWDTAAVPRLGVTSVMLTDGPHGVRKQSGTNDQLGMGRSIPATCFPTASALGSTWDPGLVEEIGRALGAEAAAASVAVLLGPGINIKRTPLCGRNFEYLSEDPVVSGLLGSAWVTGVQSCGVGASLKHLAANNQETDRMRVSAEVDERTLREIYLAAFERVVTDAGPWTVMCSYNRINGTYVSEHRWLLTGVLREEWGFDGLVVSDWGAVSDRVAGLLAGLDLEMPGSRGEGTRAIVGAVSTGALDVAVLDVAAGRVLTLLDRVRSADGSPAGTLPAGPVPDVASAPDFDAHHALARTAAAAGAVLLKNDGRVLPLDPGRPGSLAVIGELARTPRYQGAGSSQVNPTRLDNALDALRAGAGRCAVAFAAAYDLGGEGDAAVLTAEAVAVAAGADTVLVFLGLPSREEAEGFDRRHLELPAAQLAVLEAVAAVNDRVVVVLANGGVVTVSAWQHQAQAVLEMWLAGQAGGEAVADVVYGVVPPSGRLAETIPLRLEDTPAYGNFPGEDLKVRYGEGVFVGYRWYDARRMEVAYPFGHGLTYTDFTWSELEVVVGRPGASPRIHVACTVTNTGPVAGADVVQLYVGDPECSLLRPVRELKAFAKVALEPGCSARVRLALSERDLSYFHPRHGAWVIEPGRFTIELGASSRDLRLATTVEVEGAALRVPLDADSSLSEWLADPDGLRALAEMAGSAGSAATAFGDGEVMDTMASMPLRKLALFAPDAFDMAALLQAVKRDAPDGADGS